MTIKEIALRANVSIGTVDRVLNNRGRVSKKTEENIRKIIKEIGYTPNIFGRRLSISKTYIFSVLIPKLHQDSQYWEMSAKGIDKAVSELKPYKINVNYLFYDKYSEQSQRKVLEKFMKSEMDGALIAPANTAQIKTFFSKLPKEIPYVLFNANIPDTDPVSFIGQDSFQSGVLAAKLMNLLIKNEGNSIAIIKVTNDCHINERAEGFTSYYKGNKNYKINLYTLDCCEKENFIDLIKKIIKVNPGLNGIFIPNSATHFGAEFVKTEGNKKIHIVGYDLVKENIDLLNEGYIDFLISQKADVQGYEGIYALYKHIVLGENISKRIMMPIDIITKENLLYYR